MNARISAEVGGTSGIDMFYSRVGLVPSKPVCRLLLTFVYREFPSTLYVAPSPRIRLVGFAFTFAIAPFPPKFPWVLATTGARRSLLRYAAPDHEAFICFKDPPFRPPNLGNAAVDQSVAPTPNKHQINGSVELIRRWLGNPQGWQLPIHVFQVLNYLPHLLGFHQLWSRSLLCRVTPPSTNERPSTDSRFNAVETCHLEGLCVVYDSVMYVQGTSSTTKSDDLREHLDVNGSKLVIVFCSQGPRTTGS